jgi:hypothetical protein
MAKKCKATKLDGNPCTKNALSNGYCSTHRIRVLDDRAEVEDLCKATTLSGKPCINPKKTDGYCRIHRARHTLEGILKIAHNNRNESIHRWFSGEEGEIMRAYIEKHTPEIPHGPLAYRGIEVACDYTRVFYDAYEPFLEIKKEDMNLCNLVIPEPFQYRPDSEQVKYIWYTVKGGEDDYRNSIRITEMVRPSTTKMLIGHFYISPLWFVDDPDWMAFGGSDSQIKTKKMLFDEMRERGEIGEYVPKKRTAKKVGKKRATKKKEEDKLHTPEKKYAKKEKASAEPKSSNDEGKPLPSKVGPSRIPPGHKSTAVRKLFLGSDSGSTE